MGRPLRSRSIVYITVDGVLEPLGYSQVGRLLLGLAKHGFRYHLLSLEKPAALMDEARVGELRSRFSAAGITWTYLAYDERGSALAAANNLARVAQALRHLIAKGDVRLLHARGYHSAAVSLAAKKITGVPYLFDARGRWIDERLRGGRWFTNPAVERSARVVERKLYSHAAGLVVLTQLHADDIAGGDFGPYRGTPTRVITTCTDFDAFKLEQRESLEPARVPAPVAERLAQKLVVAFVGSTNASYRHEESFELAKRVLARRENAHLLVLSAQVQQFSELVRRHRLPEDRVTVTSARHEDMPGWLARIDWAIQFLNQGVAKRGSMPTKLGEFFAAGVRPIHFGCNEEVSSWVDRAGSGVVLPSLDPAELDTAADLVVNAKTDLGLLARARQRARDHFDLAAGLKSYGSMLCDLGIVPGLPQSA